MYAIRSYYDSANAQYSVSFSIPTNFLFNFFATTDVVPEPKNGSNTISPSLDDAKINLAINFSGFWVGWSVFSGIDQKGIEISFHKLDGCVRR